MDVSVSPAVDTTLRRSVNTRASIEHLTKQLDQLKIELTPAAPASARRKSPDAGGIPDGMAGSTSPLLFGAAPPRILDAETPSAEATTPPPPGRPTLTRTNTGGPGVGALARTFNAAAAAASPPGRASPQASPSTPARMGSAGRGLSPAGIGGVDGPGSGGSGGGHSSSGGSTGSPGSGGHHRPQTLSIPVMAAAGGGAGTANTPIPAARPPSGRPPTRGPQFGAGQGLTSSPAAPPLLTGAAASPGASPRGTLSPPTATATAAFPPPRPPPGTPTPGAASPGRQHAAALAEQSASRALAAASTAAGGAWASTYVEPGYRGPRTDAGGALSLDFAKASLECFKAQGRIHERYALQILATATSLLRSEPTLVDHAVPEGSHITVCGDLHGQFYDLLHVFDINGLPSEGNPYLFNGDFVDRGAFSAEVILSLLLFKCLYPGAVLLSRGNHETRSMNAAFGFDAEVRVKYGPTVLEAFAELFCHLPLAVLLNARVLVIHGGLFSTDAVDLNTIRAIERCREPPEEGPMVELLWSDPRPGLGRTPSPRGVGVSFGEDVTRRFLQANGLSLLVRSHEVKPDGYEIMHQGLLVTVFSAPNYCDQMGNKGAFIRFGADCVPHFTTFAHSPHPAVRPMAYMSGFGGFGMAQTLGAMVRFML